MKDYSVFFTDDELKELKKEFKGLEKYGATFNDYLKYEYEERQRPPEGYFQWWDD